MKTVQKSVLIWYSPEEMFALVTGVEQYPEFLPWCDRARVLEHVEGGMTAEVGIALGGIRQTFVTRNTHEAGRRGYFNGNLESVRKDVECTYGILKKRWRCLDYGL